MIETSVIDNVVEFILLADRKHILYYYHPARFKCMFCKEGRYLIVFSTEELRKHLQKSAFTRVTNHIQLAHAINSRLCLDCRYCLQLMPIDEKIEILRKNISDNYE